MGAGKGNDEIKHKIMKRRVFYRPFIFVLMVFAGCASTSTITGSWKAPDANLRSYEKFFIAALTANSPVRQTVEDELASSLSDLGFNTMKSIDVFPPDFQNQELRQSEAVLRRIAETGSDAVVTIALIDQTSEERYVPGSGIYPVTRFGYYGHFLTYYGNWIGSLYNPGYYTTDKVYYIETNVYDVQSGRLVWSAQSESYNPSGLQDFLKGYKKAMSGLLKKEGLITAQ